MVEASIRHQPAPDTSKYSPEVVKQAVQGFKNYCRWKDTTKMDIVEQETPLVSEEYQFGGTPDAIMVKGELALGDWKTSQLAAYKQLWEENHPDRPITGGFHLCRFSKEHADFAHHFWSELDDAWEQFKLFRVAYDIDKKLKKRV
jgi:hypothetical protein